MGWSGIPGRALPIPPPPRLARSSAIPPEVHPRRAPRLPDAPARSWSPLQVRVRCGAVLYGEPHVWPL
jgi:hypothetical protein